MKKIAVIGAGTMGAGIAQVFAQSGFPTILFDIKDTAVENAKLITGKTLDKAISLGKLTLTEKEEILDRILFTANFEDLKADLLIEAVIEKLEVKTELFIRLAEQNEIFSVFATNTSSIPVTQIAAKIPHPERVIGIHFFNPAHIMKLVEIIEGVQTSPEVVQKVAALLGKTGKTLVMAKDAPGFIVNRVARHYYVEALKTLEEGVADFETIDDLLESSGFKMGPFKLMDLIGIDTNFSVTSSMYNLFHQDPKFRPSRIQQQKVDAGLYGKKSGKGFYEYTK